MLVLTRYYKAVLKRKNAFEIINPDQKTAFAAFLSHIKQTQEEIEKDWTFPRCCSEFNIFKKPYKKDLPFNDFLEEITKEGGFLSLVPKKNAVLGAARIKETVIETLRISIRDYKLENVESARAITRLFYLTDR